MTKTKDVREVEVLGAILAKKYNWRRNLEDEATLLLRPGVPVRGQRREVLLIVCKFLAYDKECVFLYKKVRNALRRRVKHKRSLIPPKEQP
jgi:hypothetical protein